MRIVRIIIVLFAVFLAGGLVYWRYATLQPRGKLDATRSLVVWSGDNSRGNTWSTRGSDVEVEDGAGRDNPRGLVVDLSGDGWRGGGLNWKGNKPDAGDNVTRFAGLTFDIRRLPPYSSPSDLEVVLFDPRPKDIGGAPREGVHLVTEGHLLDITRDWQTVYIPLKRLAADQRVNLEKVCEIQFGNTAPVVHKFAIDNIAFVDYSVGPVREGNTTATKTARVTYPAPVTQRTLDPTVPPATIRGTPIQSPASATATSTRASGPRADAKPIDAPNVSVSFKPSEDDVPEPQFNGFAPNMFPSEPEFTAKARVDLTQPGKPISERIYGVAGLSPVERQALGVPVTRWGGNRSSRFNWQNNCDNAGRDWFFLNGAARDCTAGEPGYARFARRNRDTGSDSYVCVPMLGFVARDPTGYSFSVRKYGPQKAAEPGKVDVGDGVKPDGSPVTGNDPADASVPASPGFIAEGVRRVVEIAGPAATTGVKYWVLDNEPMLWHETHRDVHPDPVSYDELWQRTLAHAEAIKAADPTARVAGLCSWGWNDLFYSAKDQGDDGYRTKSDSAAHGSVPLCVWFLRKCAEYKTRTGKPLIDILDVHWYPQAKVGNRDAYSGHGQDLPFNRLRLRTTRDLWDSNYEQESWIKDTTKEAVALIPRVKKWIADNNPGMELCLGEYNFGGDDNVTGGLAQVDVFGALAREGADLAFFWDAPRGSQLSAWRLFRSHDNRGGAFGDRYIDSSADHADVSVHAAVRSSDNALTIAVVNKNLGGPCKFTLDLGTTHGRLQAWRFDQSPGNFVREVKGLSAWSAGPVQLRLPPASATMFVIRRG